MDLVAALGVAAFVFAVPQLLPQVLRVTRDHDPAGVSPAWAALTVGSNTGWLTYFLTTGLLTATIPAATSTVLAITIVLGVRREGVPVGRAVAIGATWIGLLGLALALGGPLALGGLLGVAFTVQVMPSLISAWRDPRPTGVARSTWLLIAAEVSCWLVVGLLEQRPPLVGLGITGISASAVMLWLTRPGRTAPASPAWQGAAATHL